jgi:outer membrane protein insertion porin family
VDDKKLILDFYKKKGFRDADILSDSIWYDQNKENMFIKINVYEGMQYHIRNIKWIGNTVFSDTVLSEQLGFKKGDVYDMEKFEMNLRGNEQQSDVYALYQNSGYLTFQAIPEELRIPPDSVDIVIRMSERNQFKIGLVNIKGNGKTKEKVIRRELYTLPGDYFSRAAIIRSIRQLANLQYFVPEKIKPDYSLVGDSTVNLAYEVEERTSDTFNASVGYSGTFGFTGMLGLTFNNFSISEPLSGGGGQQLNFEWQFGEASTYRTFSIGFNEPWFLDTPTLLGFSLFDSRYAFYGLDERTTGGSARIGRRFRWPDDYFRGDWTLSFQRFQVNEDQTGRFQLGTYLQTRLQQIISRNSIDNPLFPTFGSSFSLSTELAGGFLPGQSDYYKINFAADWYTPLFRSGQTTRLALYSGAQFGVLGELKDGTFINYYDFFRMGGGGLVYATIPLRGYDDGVVGPIDEKGSVISGKVMAKFTMELRFQLSPDPIPIYLLAFAEAGNVWKDWGHTDLFELKRSAGIGVRLLIQPVGLIGFDYGYGFDPVRLETSPSGWKFHFQFGKGF